MTVDGLFDAVPEAVRIAARAFSQGDVLEGIPLAYFAVGQHAATSLSQHAADEQGLALVAAEGEVFAFGVITTQSCDVTEEDAPEARKPWIQLAPVYRWDEVRERDRVDIEDLLVPNLVRLTGPTFSNGFWVADLRLSLPFEKSALVGRQPIAGFVDERDARRFAEHCAAYINRSALPGDINELIVKHINRYFENKEAARKTLIEAQVTELRLQYTEDIPPIAGIVVFADDLSPQNEARIADIFREWETAARGAAGSKRKEIRILPTKISSRASMLVADYDRTVPFRTARILARPQ